MCCRLCVRPPSAIELETHARDVLNSVNCIFSLFFVDQAQTHLYSG